MPFKIRGHYAQQQHMDFFESQMAAFSTYFLATTWQCKHKVRICSLKDVIIFLKKRHDSVTELNDELEDVFDNYKYLDNAPVPVMTDFFARVLREAWLAFKEFSSTWEEDCFYDLLLYDSLLVGQYPAIENALDDDFEKYIDLEKFHASTSDFLNYYIDLCRSTRALYKALAPAFTNDSMRADANSRKHEIARIIDTLTKTKELHESATPWLQCLCEQRQLAMNKIQKVIDFFRQFNPGAIVEIQKANADHKTLLETNFSGRNNYFCSEEIKNNLRLLINSYDSAFSVLLIAYCKKALRDGNKEMFDRLLVKNTFYSREEQIALLECLRVLLFVIEQADTYSIRLVLQHLCPSTIYTNDFVELWVEVNESLRDFERFKLLKTFVENNRQQTFHFFKPPLPAVEDSRIVEVTNVPSSPRQRTRRLSG